MALLGLEFAGGALIGTAIGAAMSKGQNRRLQEFIGERRTIEEYDAKMLEYGFTGRKCTSIKFVQVVQQSPEGLDVILSQHDFQTAPAEIKDFVRSIFLESLSLRPCDPALHRESKDSEFNPGTGATGYYVLMAVQALDGTMTETKKSVLEGRTKEEVRDDIMIMGDGNKYREVANLFYSYDVDGRFAAQGFTDDELKNDFGISDRMMRRALLSHLGQYTRMTHAALQLRTKDQVRDDMISLMGDKYKEIADLLWSYGIDGRAAAGFSDEDFLQDDAFKIDDSIMRKALLSHLDRYRPNNLCMVGITASSIKFDHQMGWFSKNVLPLSMIKATMLSLMAQDSVEKGQLALEDDSPALEGDAVTPAQPLRLLD